MVLATSLYPIGTALRIKCESRAGRVTEDYTGQTGIVCYHYNDGDVALSRNGKDDDDSEPDNDLGYYSADEVEPTTVLPTPYVPKFAPGVVVTINVGRYRGGQQARVVEWSDGGSGPPRPGWLMVAHLPIDGDYTSYRVEDLTPVGPPTLIGKRYWPDDNSYARCLTDPAHKYSLAGIGSTKPEMTTILLEPFDSLVDVDSKGNIVDRVHKMVIVQCLRGHYHQVLFDERGLVAPS